MGRSGRRPQPGQIGFDGHIVGLPAKQGKKRGARGRRRAARTLFVMFANGRIVPEDPTIEVQTAEQAVAVYLEKHRRDGQRVIAIARSELITPIMTGMTEAQARGLKPYRRPRSKPPAIRIPWVVFDGNHRVLSGKQPVWVYSEPQAVAAFRHDPKRMIDPGGQGYAIRAEELIGSRDIPLDEFCRGMAKNACAGMTEEQMRGVLSVGRPRRTNP